MDDASGNLAALSGLSASGNVQLPILLGAYAARPAWQVAGVDYAVGVPTGLALRDPSTISGPGVSVDTTNHTVEITGSNVTLNGYDFGLDGGWGINVDPAAQNTTVVNCNFHVGSSDQVPIYASPGSGNLAVANCTLDGSGGNGDVWALIAYSGTGTLIVQGDSFLNAPEDGIDLNSGTMTTNISFNLFENMGTSPGSHPDPVQYDGVDSINSVESFNTIYQPNPGGMQGIQLQAQGGSTLTNTILENNVIVAQGPAIDMSYSVAVIQNAGNSINGATVANNYIDYTGAYGPFYPPSGSNLTFSGNVDMLTGAIIPAPPGASGGASGGPTASDTLVVNLSADIWNGPPKFLLSIDGVQQGGAQNVTALHGAGQSEAFAFTGSLGTGPHDVAISFINDAYGGTEETDRNLYVNSIQYDGMKYAQDHATLFSAGTVHFAVG